MISITNLFKLARKENMMIKIRLDFSPRLKKILFIVSHNGQYQLITKKEENVCEMYRYEWLKALYICDYGNI